MQLTLDDETVARIREVRGCGDGSCVFRFKRGGQVTNGGCRCLRSLFRDDWNSRLAIGKLLDEIRKQVTHG
jgi:hypothetical protein